MKGISRACFSDGRGRISSALEKAVVEEVVAQILVFGRRMRRI